MQSDKADLSQSITTSVKRFLDDPIANEAQPMAVHGSFSSVIENAQAEGLSLQQYVEKFPQKAIREAEASLAEWLKIQTMAAIEGVITTDEGSFTINKNTTKLLEIRVREANNQLNMVNEYLLTAYNDADLRKDHIIRTLYKRGIKGDTRALIYLVDRVDGRPAEARQTEIDYDYAYNVYQIIHLLFDKQLEVLNSGNGTVMVCCSRRAGKTMLLVAALLIETLRTPNTTSIYIGETMELSEKLIDSAANYIIDTCQLKDKRGKRLDWKRLDNGSSILVRGLSNTKDPDQIRGNKAKVIVIDEFFHLKSDLLEYLQREVLQPMQMDYADSYKFICAGTPPSTKGSFGEYAWRTWNVPHFFWTYKDNPHPVSVAERDQYVLDVLKEKGLDMTSSYARREYNGEWIYDDDLLLYPEFHTYNPREGVPQFHIDQVLIGIDYGVSDNDTLFGLAWDNENRRGYEFHESKFNRLDIKDRTISQLEYLRDQVKLVWAEALEFFPDLEPREANKRILWDADDNNQHVTDDFNMNVRLEGQPMLRLNIQNAHKTDKVMMFDKIKDLLRTGNLLLIEGGKAAHECEVTVLRRGPGGQIYPEVNDKVFHPDLLPALRYAIWNVIGQESAPKEHSND
jgi:hypothetical protein